MAVQVPSDIRKIMRGSKKMTARASISADQLTKYQKELEQLDDRGKIRDKMLEIVGNQTYE